MVKTCCVKNCDIATQENVICFRFPNNRLLKRKWIDAIGLTNKLTGNPAVCIKHFQEDDYDIVRGRPRLKAKVIPSVFCESDKQLLSPCITEDDIVSNEINTDITLKNIQNCNLDLAEGNIDMQNETRIELSNHDLADVANESRKELHNEEKTELQSQSSADVQKEAGTMLQHNGGTTLNAEGSTELNNEGEIESQNIANANIQSESKEEVLNNKDDKVQNEGSIELHNEGSIQNKNENGKYKVQKRRKTKPNGVLLKDKKNEKGYQDSFIESTTKPRNNMDDLSNDIEDIIVNYQIKQTRPVHATELERIELEEHDVEDGMGLEELGKESDPVFIEVAVQGDRAGSPRDCLMVLESVQVELDPSTFLADGEPDDCHETVDLAADDDDQSQDRRPDPISLLTSSDEDEVIIQEPEIDTVEVSDETDEDDVPLVKLLKKPKKKKKVNISMWHGYKYFCMDCQYTSTSKQDYKVHTAKHSTILQVCEICDYTTASKSQFSRHKRKHKEDRKHKCHLCDYKAKHNMSLIYHLKSHLALSTAKKGFKCDKCGFKSDVKTVVLKHVKLCCSNVKKYSCDKCVYETKRPSDLKRHKARRHNEDQDDDEEFVP